MTTPIKWHNSPTVFSDAEPSSELFFPWCEEDWKWYNILNHRWYDRQGGQWVMQGSASAVGIDFEHCGDTMEITKLTIVGGLVTELEYET